MATVLDSEDLERSHHRRKFYWTALCCTYTNMHGYFPSLYANGPMFCTLVRPDFSPLSSIALGPFAIRGETTIVERPRDWLVKPEAPSVAS